MHRLPHLVAFLLMALALNACSTSTSPSIRPTEAGSASASSSGTSSSAPSLEGTLAWGKFAASGLILYTAKPDGSDERTLLPQGPEQPRWSPDGSRISVVGESPQGLVFVGLVNPDGSHHVRFDSPDPTLNLACSAWSADAERFACEGWDDANPNRNGIYTVRASDGGDLTRITTAPDGAHDIPGDYSPDGSQIVFLRDNLTDEEHNLARVINVDGSNEHLLTDTKVGLAIRWSPDGTMILTEAGGSLLLVPAAGGGPTAIDLQAPAGSHATRASWSPDGSHIVFSLGLSGSHTDIYTARADGSGLAQVTDTPGEDEEFSDWGRQ